MKSSILGLLICCRPLLEGLLPGVKGAHLIARQKLVIQQSLYCPSLRWVSREALLDKICELGAPALYGRHILVDHRVNKLSKASHRVLKWSRAGRQLICQTAE